MEKRIRNLETKLDKIENKALEIYNQYNYQTTATDMSNIKQTHSGSGDNTGKEESNTSLPKTSLKYDFQNVNFSGGFAGRDYTGNVTNNNIYNSQNLTEAAKEIKALLDQLDQEYHNPALVGAKAIEKIENNPSLKAKFINALKEGGTEALN